LRLAGAPCGADTEPSMRQSKEPVEVSSLGQSEREYDRAIMFFQPTKDAMHAWGRRYRQRLGVLSVEDSEEVNRHVGNDYSGLL